MNAPPALDELAGARGCEPIRAERIRIRGVVQGVGFRPTVFRVARELGVRGDVRNDGEGVLIHAWAAAPALEAFVQALRAACPPLASIDSIQRAALEAEHGPSTGAAPEPPLSFEIATTFASRPHTFVVPDAAACARCVQESLDPFNRRYRYPFTNCTHCGPRLSIVRGIPYDRQRTSMAEFALCEACRQEYEDPGDPRFHAQPNACHACGPRARLVRADGRALCTADLTQLDDVDAAGALLRRGEIVAIKGIGGFHLACDATHEAALARLRQDKGRAAKPLALMARDVRMVRRYASPSAAEVALLESPAAPIVVLDATGPERLPALLAPGQRTLGFLLPYTPLHHLLLQRMDRPIVLTSANPSDEPQCIDDAEARERLGSISPYLLLHDRPIVSRVDDSVVRVLAGAPRVLRSGRGYAPLRRRLPPGFAPPAPTLALGGELKNTFCLLEGEHAILSQHIGDLENARTFEDYTRSLTLYRELYRHSPERLVVDLHPEYLSSKLGRDWAEREGLALERVQHHHAHVAACLGDNAWPLTAGPVLGVALDGLGLGDDGQLWGGEFLLADYRGYRRLATFKPVALLGGEQAVREPWRNTLAHLWAELGWTRFELEYGELELCGFLKHKPLAALAALLDRPALAPRASSCGRLFDAVAAAAGICRSAVSYEGQAAIELEAAVDPDALASEGEELEYPFSVPRLVSAAGGTGLPYIEPVMMWQALLGDLLAGTPTGVVAARFHKGLARVLVHVVERLCRQAAEHGAGAEQPLRSVALTGGVFQNRTLLELVRARLEQRGYQVLLHRDLPPSDAGLALGQALIAAARAQH